LAAEGLGEGGAVAGELVFAPEESGCGRQRRLEQPLLRLEVPLDERDVDPDVGGDVP
jgi:hypothetical protein